MPYPSPQTPSSFPQDEYEYHQPENHQYPEESPNPEPQESTRDLFYGTEELLDALPKIWTQGVLYTLIGFAIIGIPWATLSKIDETGTARGRIEPKGATHKLDSLAGGSVKIVNIKEGDRVKAGQVLLELESDILQTELQQTQSKLEGLQNRRSQLELLQNQLQLSIGVLEQQNQSQASEKLAQVSQAQQNLDTKQSTYNLQKLEREAQLLQVQQQINTAINEQKAASSRLEIDTKQVERFSKLVEDGAVSATQIDELKKQQQESKRLYERATSDITQAKYRLTEEQNRSQATINQLQSDIKQAKLRLQEAQSSAQSTIQAGKLAVMKTKEQLKDLQTQITAIRSEIAQTQSQITAIKLKLQQYIVRSPIDGTIFELPVTKPGAVIQPGQRIAQIAPKTSDLVLKAQMPSQDSGFLKVGMPVKVKFDAYPFQEYGIVPGKVTWISPDSKINETPAGNIGTYELEVTLEQRYVQSGNKQVFLTAGQTANAEVIIRQRRVIDFVLDPFKKLQKGGLDM